MDFITLTDCTTDNILTCEDSDVSYANSYLLALAEGFGLSDDEIRIPCSALIRRTGVAKAYQIRAMSMVGSDSTVMADGSRNADIYLQKYKLYAELTAKLESRLSFADFAAPGTSSAGKGGIGVIRLSRS